jgi:hypothetical protein
MSRTIRNRSHGQGSSSSTARGRLTGGGSRGSARSSELRRPSEVCAATLALRTRLQVHAAPLEVAPIGGGDLRVLAAPAVKLDGVGG